VVKQAASTHPGRHLFL